MICAFVMGGNGSVAIPPSVDLIISSSTTAGIVVRFGGTRLKRKQ
jgi:hypothetical protein